MDELDGILGSLAFEEEGSLAIASARWRAEGCVLLLDVDTGDDAVGRRAFELRWGAVRACRVGGERAYGGGFHREHPLLVPYTDRRTMLSALGHPPEPRAVLADLWARHRALLQDWVPFTAFLNNNLPLAELLALGGVVAEGPQSVLQAYAAVLEAHGIQPSLVGERPPVRWSGQAWEPERDDLLAFVAGDFYVVGADLEVRAVPVDLLDRVA